MAKKQKVKNMKLEQNELNATTIGVFESRKKTSFGIFVIMTVFILAIVFMPEISDFINKYLDPDAPIENPQYVPKPIVPPTEDEPDQVLSELTSDLQIEAPDIKADNFNLDIENNTLSFKAENTTSNNIRLNNLNYYVEVYNEDQTLLQRIKILESAPIGIGQTMQISNKLNEGVALNVKLVSIVKKDIIDYPPIFLSPNDEGVEKLVCSNAHENVSYIFEDNKLQEIDATLSYASSESDYLQKYDEYRLASATYDEQDGIISLFSGSQESGEFNITTNVDLNTASRFYLFNADTFSLGTEPKVVSFEMEAQGFTCE